MRRAVYERDKNGNIWKHYDSKLFPDQRRKVMFTPEMADALPQPIKFKRDHFREATCDCCGKTLKEVTADLTNQPREEI